MRRLFILTFGLGLFCAGWCLAESAAKPDFTQIKNASSRRRAFVEFLHPKIVELNQDILRDRKQLLKVYAERHSPKEADLRWVELLAASYKMDFEPSNEAHWQELISRVDVIPASLALAQAATESGWGTSRFAKDANNFFGHHCYGKGCGMVPRGRPGQLEIKIFANAVDSVKAYFSNLNSNRAYAKVRRIRSDLRKAQKSLDPNKIADGLNKYSTRGQAYIHELKTMIKKHELDQYESS